MASSWPIGVTYQCAVNGLASATLSIFNMDHPRDQAWLKKTFDTVAPDGALRVDQVDDLLMCFYRGRPEGPTLSGSYLFSFPPQEREFLVNLFADGASTVFFEQLLNILLESQATLAEPTAPLEYSSGNVLRNDLVKHTRRVLAPQQQARVPMTTAQEVGWEAGAMPASATQMNNPFHVRTSANTQFQDAIEKHTWGRSIGGEFSKYAAAQLLRSGGFGMGI